MNFETNTFFHKLEITKAVKSSTDNSSKADTDTALVEKSVEILKKYLSNQQSINHNFGLTKKSKLPVIGKMFGVLVVEDKDGNTGFLAGFSGKMAGSNHIPGFVNPVYDSLAEDGFLNVGMEQLKEISAEIEEMKDAAGLAKLRAKRKAMSNDLQQKLFESYSFLNNKGESKDLLTLFQEFSKQRPPSGAGECAGPKLLNFAFKNNFKPVALTEFWWGKSPKSQTWKHGKTYEPCLEKCEPILEFMLKDTALYSYDMPE